ncbi:MAG TPA: hypothetical protein VHP58_01860 [Alphaproteobacteria bacterium]|nr:hypothetical protein [Alphaproteobacteria bacterium]
MCDTHINVQINRSSTAADAFNHVLDILTLAANSKTGSGKSIQAAFKCQGIEVVLLPGAREADFHKAMEDALKSRHLLDQRITLGPQGLVTRPAAA